MLKLEVSTHGLGASSFWTCQAKAVTDPLARPAAAASPACQRDGATVYGALTCGAVLICCHWSLAKVSAHALQEAIKHGEYVDRQMHEQWIIGLKEIVLVKSQQHLSTSRASAQQDTLCVPWLPAKHEPKPQQGAGDNI